MKTLRAGLIGDYISQTRLPAALRLMGAAHGIGLDFTLIDTSDRPEFDFADTVAVLQAAGWHGVSVTHPYKQAAATYAATGMIAEVRHLGASNLLIFGDPIWGGNTDYTGFLSAWHANMGDTLVGTVAMAGAGGVARALGPALARLGADEIRIFDLSEGHAKDLAGVIGSCARVVAADQWPDAVRGANGLVNATPMGMTYQPGSAFATDLIGVQDWAFDAVYTPTNTDFLTDCTLAGLRVLSGFDLFRHMAMRSFQAYTGITPDPAQTLKMLAPLRPD